jgi:hypothetical protein
MDAEKLAKLADYERDRLRPVVHRSAEAQANVAVLRARDALVAARTKLINHQRGPASDRRHVFVPAGLCRMRSVKAGPRAVSYQRSAFSVDAAAPPGWSLLRRDLFLLTADS